MFVLGAVITRLYGRKVGTDTLVQDFTTLGPNQHPSEWAVVRLTVQMVDRVHLLRVGAGDVVVAALAKNQALQGFPTGEVRLSVQ